MTTIDRQESVDCAEAVIDRRTREIHLRLKLGALALALTAWWLVYRQLEDLAAWLTYGLMGLARGTHLGTAVAFFLYDVPKIFMLLTLVVFGVGILRSFFTPERTRAILAGTFTDLVESFLQSKGAGAGLTLQKAAGGLLFLAGVYMFYQGVQTW